jgi:hypothetical protein
MMKKNYVFSLLLSISCMTATFAQLTTVREDPNPSDNTEYLAIAVNAQKQIWTGTKNGKLYYRENKKWIPVSAAGVALGEIRTIAFDNKKGTWIGSLDKGLFYRDSAGVWTTYNKTTTGASSSWVVAIKVAQNGKVFVGTTSELLEFDGTTWSKYTKTSVAPKQLIDNGIVNIKEDSKHNIWLLDKAGALHRIGLDGTWFTFKNLTSSNYNRDIEIDKLDNIYVVVGTVTYKIQWNNIAQKYDYNYVIDKIVGFDYANLTFDRKGILWMSGRLDADGLNWYDGKEVKNMKEKDDNLPYQIFEIVLDPFVDNKIWVCGTGGWVFEVTTPAAGVDTQELNLDSALKVYVANESLQVTWSGNYTAQNITIFDTMGRVILQQSIPDAQQEAQFLIPNLTKGIYLLQLNTKEGIQTIKISI